jgi:UDP-N-acetylglucosamine 1-carboxyvinyltransferase
MPPLKPAAACLEAQFVVRRGGPLRGEVTVPGAKNSVLKLMAATLLADGVYTFTNVPAIADVEIMSDLLAAIGVTTLRDGRDRITMVSGPAITPVAPYELVERIRASINVLGPLLGRFGHVKLSLPGGDDFGSRPIDMHLAGLEAMGATFELRHGYVEAHADRLLGADITLQFPSVGATENILTAAVHAKGSTVIDNAAREPEIGDLCQMRISMGAEIDGVGSSTLTVHGVEPGSLRATTHRVVADRIQAATYVAAVAMNGGEVLVRDAHAGHMEMLLRRFHDMGLEIVDQGDGLLVHCDERLRSIDVATLPYPGIATDYQPLIVTMLAVADGVGIVTENLYPGRFRYVEELHRLGADISTDGHHAVVRGRPSLSGAPVRAPDIRAGAALVIAGLAADGETTVEGWRAAGVSYPEFAADLATLSGPS